MTWKLDKSADTNAGEVVYSSTGSGAPLVLVHGWPWSSYAWYRIIPELAETFQVFWYDMPGYGQSRTNTSPRTSLDVQAEVLSELIGVWGIEQPNILAHDVGAAVALRSHLLHDTEYTKLILMNAVALSPWGSAFFDHVRENVAVFSALPDHIHAAVVKAYISGALVNNLDDEEFENLVKPWLSAEGKERFYQQFAQADDRYTSEIEPRYGKLRCPAKILWGQDDPWIPLDRGLRLHELMSGSGFAKIPGAGHLPQMEKPSAVLTQVLDFLTS